MASDRQSEHSPLLKSTSSASAPTRNLYTSSSSSEHEDLDGEDVQSSVSHVSLEIVPTYGRLIAAHVLALLPGVALLLATVMLAFHAPCHIHDDPEDQQSDRKICRHLLSDWMSMTAFTMGLVSWSVAYSFRPAVWKVIEMGTWLTKYTSQEVAGEESEAPIRQPSSTFTTILFVLIRTSILELLRLFSVMVINAVLFAGLAHLQDQGKTGEGSQHPQLHWYLEWYDPRFTVGLWVAIGWCVTEFVVSSFQMFDRLSLYKPEFVEIFSAGEEGLQYHSAFIRPTSSFSQSTHENTSDSAATVRGNDRALSTNKLIPDLRKTRIDASSPRSKLIRARRRDTEAEVQQGEESGFSLFDAENEVEEEEMIRLREKLDDEMDNLSKARMRDELQQTLGQPLTEVPIVLCALWRIDGWLWNLGSTLLMSASVTLAQGPLTDQIPRLFPPFHLVKTTLFILISLHTLFTSMWTLALPTFGFAFVTYTSMLAGLGLCISALGRWGLLI
ncbi:hypothetical protein CBS101457_000365 [Exobasidium rhododendri]|nr:hypothetical protein CBS101457_000365 [Exobasidium rhododendri]